MRKLGILAALAMLAASPAMALPVFTGDFTLDHCSGTCGPAGTIFGSITLTDTAAGVDFDISVKNGAAFNFNGNGLSTFSFSVDKTLVAGDFSGLPSGFSPVIPNANQDGFGDFTAGVDNSNHGTSTADITFSVAGLNFSDFIKSVNGSPNVFFAIDIQGPNTKTGLIGLVDNDTQINPTVGGTTPLPAAAWLFGSVFGGGALLLRRRKKERTNA
jgi:hypothetical protein